MADPAIVVDPIPDPDPVVDPDPGEHPWGEEWRENYAGDDEKKLSYAKKYASPTAALDAGLAAQYKISSGEFRPVVPFPTEGDEKAQAEWRKGNGVPKDAKGYELGREVEEDHQTAVESILEYGWSKNQSEETIKANVDFYFDSKEKAGEAEYEADEQTRVAAEDELRAEWGPEYRTNINRIDAFLNTAKEGVKDNILNARFPDGTPFCSNPDAMRFLIDAATLANPGTTLVNLGDDAVKTITDRINEIKGKMGTDEYLKGASGEAMQAEYKELLAAKLQFDGKARAG